MTQQGFDWVWDHEHQMFKVFPHHDDVQDHADFIAGLHAKENAHVRVDG